MTFGGVIETHSRRTIMATFIPAFLSTAQSSNFLSHLSTGPSQRRFFGYCGSHILGTFFRIRNVLGISFLVGLVWRESPPVILSIIDLSSFDKFPWKAIEVWTNFDRVESTLHSLPIPPLRKLTKFLSLEQMGKSNLNGGSFAQHNVEKPNFTPLLHKLSFCWTLCANIINTI